MIQRDIPFYNLDMIISVGYRVNSRKATTFRRCPDIDDCREPYGRKDVMVKVVVNLINKENQ